MDEQARKNKLTKSIGSQLPETHISLRFRLEISGVVQGGGFRPFVYSSATNCNLSGFVSNNSGGVIVEIEGKKKDLSEFQRILLENTPHAPNVNCVSLSAEFSQSSGTLKSRSYQAIASSLSE